MMDKACIKNEETCPHAASAADEAVRKVFAILGVNVSEPKDIEEFRKDLRFGGEMRRIANHGLLALLGVLAAGLAAAVWAGIISKISGGR